ncbi:MAG TPA: hypothetical protein VLB27_00435, partial [candidate division Zixibacteria bacterium]|nr:hypothetical protein [candidate division Zixibacteria bacterium]
TATDDAATQFRSFTGPLYRHEPGRYAVTLEKVDPDFDVAGTSAYAATIAVVPGGAEVPIRATVHTNNPLALNGLEFHYGLRSGFSPEVTLRDTTGATLLRGVVRLATQGSMNAPVYADFVQLPDLGLKLDLKVEPGDKGGLETPCRVAVTEEGEALYDGILRPGDTARFGTYELAIPRLRRWCYIDVVESPFLNLVFIGFWTALAGMVITFIPRLVKRGGAG